MRGCSYSAAMNEDDEKRIAAKLAMLCVRNTELETLHAGWRTSTSMKTEFVLDAL
jgi:hypothetical protein